jgi:hypothetical protein
MSYVERAIADGHAKLTGDGEHARPGCGLLRLAAIFAIKNATRTFGRAASCRCR